LANVTTVKFTSSGGVRSRTVGLPYVAKARFGGLLFGIGMPKRGKVATKQWHLCVRAAALCGRFDMQSRGPDGKEALVVDGGLNVVCADLHQLTRYPQKLAELARETLSITGREQFTPGRHPAASRLRCGARQGPCDSSACRPPKAPGQIAPDPSLKPTSSRSLITILPLPDQRDLLSPDTLELPRANIGEGQGYPSARGPFSGRARLINALLDF
jgi:hypothetical protein